MLKFIMGKGNQHTAERLKVQKELFGFNRVSRIFGICIHSFFTSLARVWSSVYITWFRPRRSVNASDTSPSPKNVI